MSSLWGSETCGAVAEVAGALPLMFAGTPDITDIEALLGAVDGILLTRPHEPMSIRRALDSSRIPPTNRMTRIATRWRLG